MEYRKPKNGDMVRVTRGGAVWRYMVDGSDNAYLARDNHKRKIDSRAPMFVLDEGEYTWNGKTPVAKVPEELKVIVHDIEQDGYPDMDTLTGRVAFVWDGNIVSGWPNHNTDGQPEGTWEPAEDRFGGPVSGVTHWIEFPVPLWLIGK